MVNPKRINRPIGPEVDGYSMTISKEDLLILVSNIDGLPEFELADITLTVLDDGSLNILVTKVKQ